MTNVPIGSMMKVTSAVLPMGTAAFASNTGRIRSLAVFGLSENGCKCTLSQQLSYSGQSI